MKHRHTEAVHLINRLYYCGEVGEESGQVIDLEGSFINQKPQTYVQLFKS